MFTLSIALLALALILGAFGVLGVAGGSAIVASVVLLLTAGASMVVYWRRRPVWTQALVAMPRPSSISTPRRRHVGPAVSRARRDTRAALARRSPRRATRGRLTAR
jgi:hypothetical protein